MQSCHNTHQEPSVHTKKLASPPPFNVKEAMEKLTDYLGKLTSGSEQNMFAEQEATIVELTQAIGREAIGEALLHHDVSSDVISVGEQTYRKKYSSSKTYQMALGEVSIERYLYANRKQDGDGKSICPLELQAGLIEGYGSPASAKLAAWSLAHLTPQEAEDFFLKIGGMKPSKSSLDRLPKALNAQWEPQAVQQHYALLEGYTIPPQATTMSVSLDGVSSYEA